MSRIVFASTFCAALGPVLIGPAERAGQELFGLEKYTGPWLFSTVFFVEQLLFPSQWALGLGWDLRAHRQGSADLLMSFCGGMAGFASGFVRRAVGYHMLATLATLAAMPGSSQARTHAHRYREIRSAIMIVGRFVVPVGMIGMIEASATVSPSMP